ncbi:MAG: metallophosphoesterase [Bryobacteraceae bacterium]|jgi:uncharacterized protein (TIGR03437 family)
MNASESGRDHRVSRRWIIGLVGVVACALALGFPPPPAATLVHRPYLQNLGADHVTIVWSARENQSASIQYSTDASFSRSAPAGPVRTFLSSQTGMGFTFYQYRADLTGLSPGTAYSYRVIMDGQNVDPNTPPSVYRFSTPGPGPVSFLVFGDSGDGSSHQLAVALQLVTEHPNFVVHVGDIAYESGTYNEFTANYFEYYYTLMRQVCFFTIAGNHEYYTQNSAPYLALHAPPTDTVPDLDRGKYYSFDWADMHFTGLDANLLDPYFADAQARMLAWFDNDLAQSQALWKIVFFHQTAYPIFHHINDPIDIAARALFVPILERHGVQLVLSGHEHTYQRSKPMRGGVPVPPGTAGTVYMVSGGGGGALHPVVPESFLDWEASVWHYLRVSVDGQKLTIQAIGTDGKEFDRLVLTQPPPLVPSDSVVNGASFTSSLATGELVSIFGQRLASGTSQASGFPLPISLDGSTVTLNGVPMALIFASPGQINAALPLDALGPATVRVTTSAGFAETEIDIADVAPAIFPSAITHADGTLVSPAAPVTPGETLVIYMTGLGQVDGKIGAGQAAPSSPLLGVLAPVQVQIGATTPITPDFAGLAPGFVGVYQVNVAVPQDLPAMVYPLRVSVKGIASNSQNIQVQSRNP